MTVDVPKDFAARCQDLYPSHVDALVHDYARVLHEHSLDAVVLHTGTPQQRSIFDDQDWPLVMVPHTKHWAPLSVPDSLVVVRAGQRPTLVVNRARGYWDGPAVLPSEHFWGSFAVVEVNDPAELAHHTPTGRAAFVGENAARAQALGVPLASAALLKDLDALRICKSPYEVACLKEANRLACRGHDAVLAAFQEGEYSELDLHLLYLKETKQDDPETPYKNIVALGEHAATLHHVGYGKQRQPHAQSLLLDAGATCCGYDSDITRTAVKGQGAAADAFAALVHGVDELQQTVCARVRPGVAYERLHNEAHELLAEVLRTVGLAQASAQELVDSGATRKLLPHGLGHSLGIQTHDVGCRNIAPEPRNPFLRNTSTIAVGQVFTIEPGCYFIPQLLDELRALPVGKSFDWSLVEALAPFGGVRVEDDVQVTTAGIDNMTRTHLPR